MRKRILTIAIICLTIAVVISIYGICYAGPECKTYGLFYGGDYYAIQFSCETSGIGAAYMMVNNIPCLTRLYFFTGDMVLITGFANFEYFGEYLWLDLGEGYMFWLE